jgi:hypothetical protein
MNKIASTVISATLNEAKSRCISIYTFALYYDHESSAISVCIDTIENSKRSVRGQNIRNNEYFFDYVAQGDLESAARWKSNIERNTEVGDFAYINLQRQELASKRSGRKFFIGLLETLISYQEAIAELATNKENLVFCCSGPNYEVEYIWSAMSTNA